MKGVRLDVGKGFLSCVVLVVPIRFYEVLELMQGVGLGDVDVVFLEPCLKLGGVPILIFWRGIRLIREDGQSRRTYQVCLRRTTMLMQAPGERRGG